MSNKAKARAPSRSSARRIRYRCHAAAADHPRLLLLGSYLSLATAVAPLQIQALSQRRVINQPNTLRSVASLVLSLFVAVARANPSPCVRLPWRTATRTSSSRRDTGSRTGAEPRSRRPEGCPRRRRPSRRPRPSTTNRLPLRRREAPLLLRRLRVRCLGHPRPGPRRSRPS